MPIGKATIIEELGLPPTALKTHGKAKAYGTYFIAYDLRFPNAVKGNETLVAQATSVRIHVWHMLKHKLGCYRWQYSVWVVPEEEKLSGVRAIFEAADVKLRELGLPGSAWQIVPVITSIEVQEAIGKSLSEGMIDEVAGYYESFTDAMDLGADKRAQKLATLRRLQRNLAAAATLWESESGEFKKIDPEVRKQAAERMEDLRIQIESAVDD